MDQEQLEPFTTGGRRCVRLITTRNPELAARAVRIPVGEMSTTEAERLLTYGLPPLDPPLVSELLEFTGNWPGTLRRANKILANTAAVDGAAVPQTASQLIARLRAEGPTAAHQLVDNPTGRLSSGNPEGRAHGVQATIASPFKPESDVRQQRKKNRSGMAGHVFISYVREDAHHVDRLQTALEAEGLRVWRDTEELWPGQDWRANIRHAITNDALVFLACFSHLSTHLNQSYQNEELLLAIEQLRRRSPEASWLIPVRLDECDIPDRDLGGGRTLRSIQWADLFGDSAERNMTRLVAVIRELQAATGRQAIRSTDRAGDSH